MYKLEMVRTVLTRKTNKEDKILDAKMWYWLILMIWIIFGGVEWFWEDPRIRRGGNLVLIILLIIIGFMVAGSPIK